MPSMTDSRFEKSVVLIVAHSDDGAMGLIVNKPNSAGCLKTLLSQLEIANDAVDPEEVIYFGGPVETGRGFVLYGEGYETDAPTVEMPGGFRMTATMDVLEDIGAGRGPGERIVALGYSGWSPGQLEGEIQQDGWLVADAPAELVFGADNGSKWTGALKLLGIDGLNLSSGVRGRA